MAEFTGIKKAAYKGQFKKAAEEIYDNYKDLLKEHEDLIRSGDDEHRALRRFSTDTRWEQFVSGKITEEQACDYAIARETRSLQKEYDTSIQKLVSCDVAPEIESIEIYVDWKRSAVWGLNPSAEITLRLSDGNVAIYRGYASGCGYDKRSAAVASALKDSAEIKRLLLERQSQLDDEGKLTPDKDGYCHFPYGCGYDQTIPGFEGGVGIECHLRGLEDAGFEIVTERQPGGTKPDYYYLTRIA